MDAFALSSWGMYCAWVEDDADGDEHIGDRGDGHGGGGQ